MGHRTGNRLVEKGHWLTECRFSSCFSSCKSCKSCLKVCRRPTPRPARGLNLAGLLLERIVGVQHCVDLRSCLEYDGGMKVKTSITLSEELLAAIDQRARERRKNRSDFIEAAARAFIEQLARGEQDARDLEILNGRADSLNVEAADVLEYQAPL